MSDKIQNREKTAAAMNNAAQLVARDGIDFIPAFLALEAEMSDLSGKRSATARAMAMIGGGAAVPQIAISESASARPDSPPPSP